MKSHWLLTCADTVIAISRLETLFESIQIGSAGAAILLGLDEVAGIICGGAGTAFFAGNTAQC